VLVAGCTSGISGAIRWPGSSPVEEFGITFPYQDADSPVSFSEVLLCLEGAQEAEIESVGFAVSSGITISAFATRPSNAILQPEHTAFESVTLEEHEFSPASRRVVGQCAAENGPWTRLGLQVRVNGPGNHYASTLLIDYSILGGGSARYEIPLDLGLCAGVPEGTMCPPKP
jgi:hypothetical protein